MKPHNPSVLSQNMFRTWVSAAVLIKMRMSSRSSSMGDNKTSVEILHIYLINNDLSKPYQREGAMKKWWSPGNEDVTYREPQNTETRITHEWEWELGISLGNKLCWGNYYEMISWFLWTVRKSDKYTQAMKWQSSWRDTHPLLTGTENLKSKGIKTAEFGWIKFKLDKNCHKQTSNLTVLRMCSQGQSANSFDMWMWILFRMKGQSSYGKIDKTTRTHDLQA